MVFNINININNTNANNNTIVAGWKACGYFEKARNAALGLAAIFPTKIEVNVHEHSTRDEFVTWLTDSRDTIGASNHKSAPQVWNEDKTNVGGCDGFLDWCRKFVYVGEEEQTKRMVSDGINPNVPHGFDYDLVVVGGGSGGLACSKEAKRLGAKVAVLDFVKPSPKGSKWGLGGTCVNVGCIPKKLMHNAALLGEATHDLESYGWTSKPANGFAWEEFKDRVQDYIKGLNFGYKVQLREKGVTYLNMLGKFVDRNHMECTDAKGKVQVISSARFVIAVGGRPTPLNIPGGELAISSDDLFSLSSPPGRTCVVGAGYVALECAGFINAMNPRNGSPSVVVLCRSMCLRGFDRDVVSRVQKYMVQSGIEIIEGITPVSIEKTPAGTLLVKYSNGEQGEFDTVLGAVGRTADTDKLGLEKLDITVNPGSLKVTCENEQTSLPNVYAIGDVVEKTPELTPVAILAGKLLARRLFGNENSLMNYKAIATAVFTPLEIGTVGLTEEEAISTYGENNIESYVSIFSPLEWQIVNEKNDKSCYAKIITLKTEDEKVIGLHIASPNAGEIIQGFAVSFKKGIKYNDLLNTVGIHPTIAEEFTIMTVSKSSGEAIEKAGC